jgi:hypothetical protein
MKTVIDSEPWKVDENVLAVPWRRVKPQTGEKMRFGDIRGCSKRPLHPPVRSFLATAEMKLEDAGHVIVPLDDIPDLYECAVLAWKYFLLDPRKTAAQHVNASGEPWVPSIAKTTFPELKGWEPSLDELFDMNVQRARIVKKYHDLVVENQLDAILMAGYQSTAVPHDTYGVPVYTVLANLLNVSALR